MKVNEGSLKAVSLRNGVTETPWEDCMDWRTGLVMPPPDFVTQQNRTYERWENRCSDCWKLTNTAGQDVVALSENIRTIGKKCIQ